MNAMFVALGLLALCVLLVVIATRWPLLAGPKGRGFGAAVGVVMGATAVALAMNPLALPSGALLDACGAPLLLAGLVAGPFAAVLATAIAVVAALSMGAPPLVGLYGMLGAIAGWWLRKHAKRDPGVMEILALSLLGSFLFLPVLLAHQGYPLTWEMYVGHLPFIAFGNAIACLVLGSALLQIRKLLRDREDLRLKVRVLDLAPDGFAIAEAGAGAGGALLYANPAFARIAGCGAEEAFARARELSGPKWRQGGRQGARQDARGTGGAQEAALGRVRFSPVIDESGRPSHLIGVIEDRSEAQRTYDLLSLITDHLPVLLAYVGRDGRYLYANARHKQWFGIEPEEMVGRSVREVIGRRNYEAIEGNIQRVLAGEEVRSELVTLIPSLGERCVRELMYPQKDDYGRVRGFVVLIEDVTEQRESEEALRQSQKLEALGKLTGGIAHDFNNLLAVVLGNLETLKQEGAEPNEALDEAVKAAEASAELTKKLLSFGRRAPLAPAVIDPNAVISGMERLLETTLSERVQLRFALDQPLSAVRVDPTMLENALLNLVLNARDALAGSGRVELRSEAVRIVKPDQSTAGDWPHRRAGELPVGDYVRVSVLDDGEGIAPEQLGRILEPFYTTKPAGKGSGLGLAMVSGFCSQSGGALEIASRQGEGTQVSLLLPASRERPSAPSRDTAAGEETSTCWKGLRVLVVEDEANVRALMVRRLKEMGFETLAAADGDEAMRILAGHRGLDFMITDVVIPGRYQGPALARAARALRPALKVLFISGYPTEVMAESGALPAGETMLMKPFKKTELRAAIHQILGEEVEAAE